MTARPVQLAQEIVDLLTSAPEGTFPESVAFERTWISRIPLEEIAPGASIVSVSCGTVGREWLSRDEATETYQASILLRRRIDPANEVAGCDDSAGLLESLYGYLHSNPTPSFGSPESIEVDPLASPDELDQNGLYMAWIGATYQGTA